MSSVATLLRKSPSARILLSTEFVFSPCTLGWWYICPHNGHIYTHTGRSLEALDARVGMKLCPINSSMRMLAWRD